MRKFDDLSDLDKGAFIVREEINKKHEEICRRADEKGWIIPSIVHSAYEECLYICYDCLDIATLGDIER